MTASTTILWFLSPVTALGMLPTPAPLPHAPGVQGSRAETSPGAPKYWGCTTSAPQKLYGCSDFLRGIFCFFISGTHKQKCCLWGVGKTQEVLSSFSPPPLPSSGF